MKQFFKAIFLVIGLIAMLLTGYWAYHHFLKPQGSVEAFQAVPDDAIFVAATTNLTKAWNDLSKSNFWAYLKTTEYFADINEDIIKEVAKMKPYYFILRDSSLSSDNVADNFDQIFQAYSKETIRRVL